MLFIDYGTTFFKIQVTSVNT